MSRQAAGEKPHDWARKDREDCALCGVRISMQKLVVCLPCFKAVMSQHESPVPVLFAEWSKHDA